MDHSLCLRVPDLAVRDRDEGINDIEVGIVLFQKMRDLLLTCALTLAGIKF